MIIPATQIPNPRPWPWPWSRFECRAESVHGRHGTLFLRDNVMTAEICFSPLRRSCARRPLEGNGRRRFGASVPRLSVGNGHCPPALV
ncbi:unnamed protein product [Urochloa humidicola]